MDQTRHGPAWNTGERIPACSDFNAARLHVQAASLHATQISRRHAWNGLVHVGCQDANVQDRSCLDAVPEQGTRIVAWGFSCRESLVFRSQSFGSFISHTCNGARPRSLVHQPCKQVACVRLHVMVLVPAGSLAAYDPRYIIHDTRYRTCQAVRGTGHDDK